MAKTKIKLDAYGSVAWAGHVALYKFKENPRRLRRAKLFAEGGKIKIAKGDHIRGEDYHGCRERYDIGSSDGVWAVTTYFHDHRDANFDGEHPRWLIVQKGGAVFKFDDADLQEAADFLGLDFSAEIAFQKRIIEERKQRAEKILAAIDVERAEYAGQEIDGILVAPEFLRSPYLWEIEELLEADKMEDEDEYILRFGTPAHWQVESPVFVKGSTAEDAVKKALKIQEERAATAEAARAEAEKVGLPSLKGTERQIAWALKIRKEYADMHPNSSTLKRATTAKFWIENRFSLPAA